ncbi:hypothetical protein CQA38_05050 [Campylobacter sp. MIT 12-5580]|uniref:hypothetical protein n=1 Tax=Campylobacter sp. MIT 12-5580 TaxID=2040651 RepID=UPI0010F911EF|nr:hypothetical protein [Campylobacter sp. MIT 12-5580]TKX28936.1 hypothetical protein CQA38_05050 [Campylobacter sp. MIT 12-5580]
MFKKAKTNHHPNVINLANEIMDTHFAYTAGFYEAAKILGERMLNEKYQASRDRLAYPFLFLYRHHLELYLKNILQKIKEFKEEGIVSSSKGCIPDSLYKELSNLQDHNLYQLFELMEKALPYVQDLKEDDLNYLREIKKMIKAMHDIDKSGQKFRYPANNNGKLFFSKEQSYELKTMVETITKVHSKLTSIYDSLDKCLESMCEYHNQHME